jgi:hypothetical protein
VIATALDAAFPSVVVLAIASGIVDAIAVAVIKYAMMLLLLYLTLTRHLSLLLLLQWMLL